MRSCLRTQHFRPGPYQLMPRLSDCQVSADGVKSTHPTYLEVDPYSMQVKAVPGLYALGPLRGDNFARFAMHDGHGVVASLASNSPPRVEVEITSDGTVDLSGDDV